MGKVFKVSVTIRRSKDFFVCLFSAHVFVVRMKTKLYTLSGFLVPLPLMKIPLPGGAQEQWPMKAIGIALIGK